MQARRPAHVLRAGALAALTLFAIPGTADARYAARTLTSGSEGRDVKLLQRYMTRAGLPTRADGVYGRRTRQNQRRFERATARRVDGRASRADQRRLRRVARTGGLDRSDARPPEPAQPVPAPTNPTAKAVLSNDGRTAIAPDSAPPAVKEAITAANEITRKPYRYGGGHGSWKDSGYDCSGAVSYALHGADLIDSPRDSTGLESWGERGRGSWITVYANADHAYVVIAGLRFDTSGSGRRNDSGPRWRTESRSSRGYVARHPAGL